MVGAAAGGRSSAWPHGMRRHPATVWLAAAYAPGGILAGARLVTSGVWSRRRTPPQPRRRGSARSGPRGRTPRSPALLLLLRGSNRRPGRIAAPSAGAAFSSHRRRSASARARSASHGSAVISAPRWRGFLEHLGAARSSVWRREAAASSSRRSPARRSGARRSGAGADGAGRRPSSAIMLNYIRHDRRPKQHRADANDQIRVVVLMVRLPILERTPERGDDVERSGPAGYEGRRPEARTSMNVMRYRLWWSAPLTRPKCRDAGARKGAHARR